LCELMTQFPGRIDGENPGNRDSHGAVGVRVLRAWY
jgi:hypothetical protein